MEQKKILAVDNCHINNIDNETHSLELFSEKGLCDQLVDKIMSISPELREKFQFQIAVQGAGLKIPRSGFGEIEVTPFKMQLIASPVWSN